MRYGSMHSEIMVEISPKSKNIAMVTVIKYTAFPSFLNGPVTVEKQVSMDLNINEIMEDITYPQ